MHGGGVCAGASLCTGEACRGFSANGLVQSEHMLSIQILLPTHLKTQNCQVSINMGLLANEGLP